MHKIIGAILLILGVILIIRGHDIAQSVNSQVKNLFTGSPTDKVIYYYVGGAICSALGLVGIFLPGRK